MAIAAITTIASAALTPAVGVVVAEVALGGAPVTGDLIGQAAQAAVKGIEKLADPATIARKAVQKAVTKGKSIKD